MLKSAIRGLLNNQGHQELSINFNLYTLIPTKSTAEVSEYFNVAPNSPSNKTNGVIMIYFSCPFEVQKSQPAEDGRLFREAIVDTVDVCDDIIDISEDVEIIDDISSELFRS
nr:6667_t:CDS:2 [Entrophospora candida]